MEMVMNATSVLVRNSVDVICYHTDEPEPVTTNENDYQLGIHMKIFI